MSGIVMILNLSPSLFLFLEKEIKFLYILWILEINNLYHYIGSLTLQVTLPLFIYFFAYK